MYATISGCQNGSWNGSASCTGPVKLQNKKTNGQTVKTPNYDKCNAKKNDSLLGQKLFLSLAVLFLSSKVTKDISKDAIVGSLTTCSKYCSQDACCKNWKS